MNGTNKAMLSSNDPESQPRELALVGFGNTMNLMYELHPDIPIWTLNAAEDYDFPRIDALFEMHQPRDIILEKPRMENLQKKHNYPIYMLDSYSWVPDCVKLPFDVIDTAVFHNIFLGNDNASYWDSSLAYMIPMAYHEGYDVIHIYGFGLASDTEYIYQRPGAALMIGWAAGKGMTVVLPDNTELLPKTKYGFDDYQSISRQNAEQWLRDIQIQESDWLGKMNMYHERVMERQRRSLLFRFFNWCLNAITKHSNIHEANEARAHAYRQMYMRQGGQHVLLQAIQIMDRKRDALKEFEFTDNFFVAMEGDEITSEKRAKSKR